MKNRIGKIVVAAMFAATASIQADAKPHSKSIVLESASGLPEIAQRNSAAMYLHETGDGRAILYLEQDQGKTLAILDVSDPAAIRALAQVSIDAPSPYDFVQSVKDSAVLIHYRDHSGFAVINFRRFQHPVLTEAPQLKDAADTEVLGYDGLLLASIARPSAPDPEYKVIDISNPSDPRVLGSIEGVQQRLERTETGTLFLLDSSGLTVIRRPNVEEEYKIELNQQNAN